MSNMPVFENPCGAYSRYEITKHIPLDRLQEICEAEREGRLKLMPCSVGDIVYEVKHPTHVLDTSGPYISPLHVSKITLEQVEGHERLRIDARYQNKFGDGLNTFFCWGEDGIFATETQAQERINTINERRDQKRWS